MRINARPALVLSLALTVSFISCKKEDKPDPVTDPASEIAAHADDQNRISAELDAVAADANTMLESEVNFSGKMMDPQEPSVICGATTVVDTTVNPRTITITYNGLNCSGTHLRTGTVILSAAAGARWKNPGTVIKLSFNQFNIKRVSDNKSITINGDQFFTNVTGGLLYQLPTLNNITHTIQSNGMSITFDNNTQRTWNIARKRSYTYNNGVVLQVEGDHTIGNTTGIAEWGVNRFGHPFTTSVLQPLTFRQDCNFRLTAGELKHEGFATSTVKFGLDSQGNPTACPQNGPYYLRITWTGPNGNTATAIHPY